MPRDIFRIRYDVSMLAGSADTAEVRLYGEIVEDGPKWWKWSEEDKSAVEFDKAIKEVRESGATKLLLRINSPGGIVTESVAMRSILVNAGFEEINIRIEGMCASAATNIATLPGAHVVIAEGSEYMIHRPMGGCRGFASDMENYANRLRNMEQVTRGFYATKTGQSDEQIKAWMDAETWFTAEQAVEYGFADELQKADSEELPMVACADGRAIAAMCDLYSAVPEQIAKYKFQEGGEVATDGQFIEGEQGQELILPPDSTQNATKKIAAALENLKQIVSNAAPVAGDATEIHHEEEHEPMEPNEIRNITQDQLLAENPALVQSIQQAALAADRQRREDIDAITPPMAEYQALAEEAKKNGTSAMDFHKQLVAAMKQKGANHQAARQQETAPAKNVTGGAAEDGQNNEEQEIKQYAESMAKYAKEYRGSADGDMF